MTRSLIASLLFACAIILVGVSCGRPHSSATSSDTTKNAPSTPHEIKDPIISIVIASSVDEKGQLVNPRFSFPQNEKQVTAVVELGNVKGSQLTVTWYQTSDDGDQKLFEHQIQVKSHDRAFSIAKNPGGFFSAGTYKVVATIDGQTKETELDITPYKYKPPPKKTSNNRDERHFGDQAELENERGVSIETNSDGSLQKISYEPVSDQSQILTVANSSGTTPPVPTGSTPVQGQTPVSGQSGTAPQPPQQPSGPQERDCWVYVVVGFSVDKSTEASLVPVRSLTDCNGSVEVFAGVTGDFLKLGSYNGPNNWEGVTFPLDPCSLTGGSDLPGTKITLKAVATDNNTHKQLSTYTEDVTLGDDTLAPRVNVVSTPARGTKVKTGDKIKLDVTATEKRSGGPWQTGVKIIQVTAQPGGGLVKDPWVNPSALPKPCGEKTWEQKDQAIYTVPPNPPPIITICAYAEDYAGNESHQCGEFLTGDKWEGTVHSITNSAIGPQICTGEGWDSDLRLVVGGDGTVAGKATSHLTVMPQCTGVGGFVEDVFKHQSKNCRWDVSGTFDGKQFKLQFFLTSGVASGGLIHFTLGSNSGVVNTIVVPATSKTTAQGETKTNVTVPTNGRSGNGDHNVTLKCTTCK